jgi:hypothetical protein
MLIPPTKSVGPAGRAALNQPYGAPVLHDLAGHWLPVLREECPTPNLGRGIRTWKKNSKKNL